MFAPTTRARTRLFARTRAYSREWLHQNTGFNRHVICTIVWRSPKMFGCPPIEGSLHRPIRLSSKLPVDISFTRSPARWSAIAYFSIVEENYLNGPGHKSKAYVVCEMCFGVLACANFCPDEQRRTQACQCEPFDSMPNPHPTPSLHAWLVGGPLLARRPHFFQPLPIWARSLDSPTWIAKVVSGQSKALNNLKRVQPFEKHH